VLERPIAGRIARRRPCGYQYRGPDSRSL